MARMECPLAVRLRVIYDKGKRLSDVGAGLNPRTYTKELESALQEVPCSSYPLCPIGNDVRELIGNIHPEINIYGFGMEVNKIFKESNFKKIKL